MTPPMAIAVEALRERLRAVMLDIVVGVAARAGLQEGWGGVIVDDLLAGPVAEVLVLLAALEAEVERLRAERNTLAAFARDVFDDIEDRDALELQELGLGHGLLREVPFDPDRHILDADSLVLDAGEPFLELTDLCAPRAARTLTPETSHA